MIGKPSETLLFDLKKSVAVSSWLPCCRTNAMLGTRYMSHTTHSSARAHLPRATQALWRPLPCLSSPQVSTELHSGCPANHISSQELAVVSRKLSIGPQQFRVLLQHNMTAHSTSHEATEILHMQLTLSFAFSFSSTALTCTGEFERLHDYINAATCL